MNQLIPASFGPISNKFSALPVENDLSSGIQSSFGLLGYKGKVWSVRYRGDETPLMRDDGDGPKNSIEVVILRASTHISKVWYKAGYVEGSTAPPDCFSNNGIVPEPSSTDKQCETCALCPHNQWGSRITPAGKQGKACADSKRLAVVPSDDMHNEVYGGPMLLRVPAASLQDLAMYGSKMGQWGYHYFAVATKIAFDPNESYPKFIFSALRPLNDDEADIALALRDDHTTQRILSENEFQPAAAPQDDKPIFEQSDAGAKSGSVGDQARAAAAAQAQQRKPATKAATQTKPVEQSKPAEQAKTVEPVKAVTPEVTQSAPDMSKKLAALIAAGFSEDDAKQTLGIVDEPTPEPTPEPKTLDPKVAALIDAGFSEEEATAMVAAKAQKAPAQTNAQTNAQGTVAAVEPVARTEAQPEVQPEVQQEAQTIDHEEQPQPASSAGAPGVADASKFEGDLDNMLANLLPTLNK